MKNNEERIYFNTGKEQYKQGHFSCAFENFSKAIHCDPHKGVYYFWRGKTAMELSRPHHALADFNQGLNLTPNVTLYCERALCYMTLGLQEKALADLKAVSEPDQKVAKFAATQAHYYFYVQELEAALIWMNRAAQAEPQQIKWLLQQNEWLIHQQKFEEAQKIITQAKQLQSDSYFVCEQECLLLIAKGEYLQAIDFLSKLLSQNSTQAIFYKLRTLCYLKSQNYEQGLIDAQKGVELEPEDAETYTLRCQCALYCGQKELAFSDFEKVIQLNAENAQTYHFFWHFFMKNQIYPQALRCVDHLILLQPEKADFYYFRSQTDACLQQFDPAIQNITRAIQLRPYQESYYLTRAFYYRDSQKYLDAIKDLSRVIEMLQPNDSALLSLYEERARLYFTLNLFQESLYDLEKAYSFSDQKTSLLLQQIYCLMPLKQYESALQKCNLIIQSDAQCEPVYFLMTDILMQLGHFAAAIPCTQKLLSFALTEPAKDQHLLNLAWCYICTHEYEKALITLDNVSEKTRQAAYHGLCARCLSNIGKAEEAIPHWNLCLDQDPNAPNIYYVNRGICYLNSGKIEAAQKDFETAIQKDSSLALAHFWLGLVYVESDRKKQTVLSMREVIRLETAVRTEGYILPLAYLWRGRAYYHTMFAEKALEDWKQALALDPNIMQSYPQIKIDYESLLKLKSELKK